MYACVVGATLGGGILISFNPQVSTSPPPSSSESSPSRLGSLLCPSSERYGDSGVTVGKDLGGATYKGAEGGTSKIPAGLAPTRTSPYPRPSWVDLQLASQAPPTAPSPALGVLPTAEACESGLLGHSHPLPRYKYKTTPHT